jgi:transcription elongation factor GreA-like protein
MNSFDPRTLAKPVYESLCQLRAQTRDPERLKEQKNQAVELYTYLSTWGLLRLKAEEDALSQEGKKEVVKEFFDCLEKISGQNGISKSDGLDRLMGLGVEEYLGLTGLGLALAQEFSFWATAIYHDDDVSGGE